MGVKLDQFLPIVEFIRYFLLSHKQYIQILKANRFELTLEEKRASSQGVLQAHFSQHFPPDSQIAS